MPLAENRPTTFCEVAVRPAIDFATGAELQARACRDLDVRFQETLADLAAKASVTKLGKQQPGLETAEATAHIDDGAVSCVLHPAETRDIVAPIPPHLQRKGIDTDKVEHIAPGVACEAEPAATARPQLGVRLHIRQVVREVEKRLEELIKVGAPN